MVYNKYTKLRILRWHQQGIRPPTIAKYLAAEGIKVSRKGVAKFLERFLRTGRLTRLNLVAIFIAQGTIARQAGSGRRTVITEEIRKIVEEQMRRDDETTASQLHVLLTSLGYALNLRTILRCRTSLGWTFRGSAYCQLIRDVNKQKRLDFARANRSDNFANVIFTDECSVQLESHRRRCCRKEGEPPKNKPRYARRYNVI